jgi:hypothetical protein
MRAYIRLSQYGVMLTLRCFSIGLLLSTLSLSAAVGQSLTVRGRVMSNGAVPLPGVNVVIVGTSVGTSTNAEGIYTINVPNGEAKLAFSYIGYPSEQVTVGTRTQIDVTLRDDNQQLSEVVVTALGIKKEVRTLGYTTQEIKD